MAVPHTRPIGVTAHATRRELIAGYEPWLQRVQVPGSAGNLLEFRLGQQGSDAMGFAAHVPHYSGPDRLPGRRRAAARLGLPHAPACSCRPRRCARPPSSSAPTSTSRSPTTEEAGGVVQALEQQYDAFTRGPDRQQPAGTQTGPLPTADELGAELERFLA